MQAVNANGVPVVITNQAVGSTHDKRLPYINMTSYLSKQLIVFGSLQIAFGVLSIIFEIVSLTMISTYEYFIFTFLGYGFWIGILFVITGAFGIVGAKTRNRCHTIAFNVLSIISACFAVLLISLALSSATILGYSDYEYYYPKTHDAGIAVESLMAILGLAEVIVASWSSVVCCKIGACCCDCCHCYGEYCCPPSANVNQNDLTEQPYVGQPFAGQSPVGQQVYVMYTGFYQNQPVMIVNQEPLFYPLPSNQQSIFTPYDQNVMGQNDTEYTKLQH